jgi:SAM-dependent methyltransferase
MDAKRRRARELARRALADGDALRWFDELYREADRGEAVVPWADLTPNPHVVAWLDARPFAASARALDVGTGLGDNAEELARRGLDVVAFDISERAIAAARARFPVSRVRYEVGDLTAPPPAWERAFDLVAETYTLQVLPPPERARAARSLVRFVRPGGVLLVVARGREPHEPAGEMPWPLTRAEVEGLGDGTLRLESMDDFFDEEDPPVRRLRAAFRRDT